MAVTVIGKFCVLDAGAPAAVAAMVTFAAPSGVPRAVLTVTFTVAGEDAVTEGLLLSNAQLTPGVALLHVRLTVPANAPTPLICTFTGCELFPCATCTLAGDGDPIAKSTTCSKAAVSCVTAFASLPTPCTLKE